MKIAIHNRKGSFSDRWIDYCEKENIPYKLVNAYDSDIVEQVSDCNAFMWHHHHADYRDCLFAKQLLYSLQKKGLKVFPNIETTWHFDDKVGQKYLFEAINAPLVPSYVFYTKKDAIEWVNKTSFPKVFKLRGGAGSANVKLVKTKMRAKKMIIKSFRHGFNAFDYFGLMNDSINKWIKGKTRFYDVLKYIALYLFHHCLGVDLLSKQKGYVYFQEFIPNNSFDIRVVVVGDKAFSLKRLVRKNDFRASGGGSIIYDKNQIDERCVKIAFDVNEKIQSQSIAYDFVFDKDNNPLIVEISYGYTASAYDKCEGYWDKDLNWHKGENFDFCGWMVELVR